MADLDDLFAEIPTRQVAQQLGVDEGAVQGAIKTLVPLLVSGMQQKAQNPDNAQTIESAASNHAASGLLDTGVSVDQVHQADGEAAITKIFGGSDTSQVATAMSKAGAGNSELIEKLLPILAPIVLAYIGKQMTQQKTPASAQEQGSGGALNDVLGGILSGMSGSGDKSLGGVLGKALGSKAGDILGGLLGGKK